VYTAPEFVVRMWTCTNVHTLKNFSLNKTSLSLSLEYLVSRARQEIDSRACDNCPLSPPLRTSHLAGGGSASLYPRKDVIRGFSTDSRSSMSAFCASLTVASSSPRRSLPQHPSARRPQRLHQTQSSEPDSGELCVGVWLVDAACCINGLCRGPTRS